MTNQNPKKVVEMIVEGLIAGMKERKKPDIETGLVNCGCGGKAGFVTEGLDLWVECKECLVRTPCEDAEKEAIEVWNRAMGHKEDKEK